LKTFSLLILLAVPASQAQTVVATFDAPDTGISGLACGGGFLWAVDGTTRFIYKLDPASGAVLGTWFADVITAAESPAGLAFGNNTLYVSGATESTGTIYTYSPDGTYGTSFTVNC
jgi:hypothetical protein